MKRAEKQVENSNVRNGKRGKIISFTTPVENSETPRHARIVEFPPVRISIEILRSIWNDKEVTYTDEELLRIRDWFYTIAQLTLSTIGKEEEQLSENSCSVEGVIYPHNTIPLHKKDNLTNTDNEAAQKSYPLHPRIYRRAG